MNYDLIIARYGEIGIKSPKIRSRFERKLVKNIKATFECDVERNQGRIYLHPKDFDEGIEKLNRVFGVVSYSPATSTQTTYDDIDKTLTEYVGDLIKEDLIDENTKFAIKCRRVGKHDFTSQEMAAHCGGVVRNVVLAPVDLTNPDLTIFVEVRENDTFIFHEKIRGPGGLPLGTQGKVVVLLSSGIDSPVAAYLMMKRGCEVIALNCNNDPFTTPKALENFSLLVDQLNIYAQGTPIKKRVVDYGEYLQAAKDKAPEKMTCVLCKSGMYHVAEKLARKLGADAIVDGSSVGQVASQTLSNILATRCGVEMPILSPLIGLDKEEITAIAKDIGTFDISKIDDGGCSAVPRYPETHADLQRVKEACEEMNQDAEIEKAFEKIRKLD
ncbi:MAG: tRNA 4-thiouridine(8) synthase ThiI [Methanobrevibacter thaueri]|jgi:thiamine biosynthesis protein ThiI|uniref:tRNA uracil 4-sulfurtransferase ThiI n=1 Tax=Methanobrevibacter thaueri TaxID=190975 RepID=UPI0026ECDC26|nr:tRNA uracil 4-sulfurtransferase ThiI [Methanobrevibacter thaueri]MBE6495144.1 tRNA 4-thiouridine(8) synthase ThiI [Methanobrevibacter thaueri]